MSSFEHHPVTVDPYWCKIQVCVYICVYVHVSQFFITIFNVHFTIDSVFEVVDEIIFSIRHSKILIFGFEWRYPKISTFSIHFIPNCHPLLEITDIPVNCWRHNRKIMMTQMKSDCWMMSYKPSRFLNRQRVYCVILCPRCYTTWPYKRKKTIHGTLYINK